MTNKDTDHKPERKLYSCQDPIASALDVYLNVYRYTTSEWRRIISTAKKYTKTGAREFSVHVDGKNMLLFGGSPWFNPFWSKDNVTGKIAFIPLKIYIGQWKMDEYEEDPEDFEDILYRSMMDSLLNQKAWCLVKHLPLNIVSSYISAPDPGVAGMAQEMFLRSCPFS